MNIVLSKPTRRAALGTLIAFSLAFPLTANAQDNKDQKKQMDVSAKQEQKNVTNKQQNMQEALPLVGREIRNSNYDTIGEIQNVIADLDGNVKKLLISVGGLWGIFDDQVLVPVDKINITENRNYVFFNGTEEELDSFPKYREDRWLSDRNGNGYDRENDRQGQNYYSYSSPHWYGAYDNRQTRYRNDSYSQRDNRRYNDQRYNSRDDRRWNDDRRGAYDRNRSRYFDNDSYTSRQQSEPVWQAIDNNRLRASDMIGKDVYNRNNEEVGEVDDLLMERGGNITMILSVGGFLGMGDKKVRVDLRDVEMGGDRIIYNVSKKEMQNEPEYKSGTDKDVVSSKEKMTDDKKQ